MQHWCLVCLYKSGDSFCLVYKRSLGTLCCLGWHSRGQEGIVSFSCWSLTGLPSIPTETTELWIWSETTQSSTNTLISVKQSPLTHDLKSEGLVKYLPRLWFWECSSFPGILNKSGFIDNDKQALHGFKQQTTFLLGMSSMAAKVHVTLVFGD